MQFFDYSKLIYRKKNSKRDYALDNAVSDNAVSHLWEFRRPISKVLVHSFEFDYIKNILSKYYPNSQIHYLNPFITNNIEHIEATESDYDAIISSSILHWINDVPGVLAQYQNILKPGGVLVASFIGGDTLYELRSVLMNAELQVLQGASPRINPFIDIKTIGSLFSRAGFQNIVADIDKIALEYNSLLDLLHDIKSVGENAAFIQNSPSLNREVIKLAENLYEKKEGILTATVEVLNVLGVKK